MWYDLPRYQEYIHGIHNFNDSHYFSLSLMLFLRAFVEVICLILSFAQQEHTALGRAAAVFSEVSGVKMDLVHNAYYHFEALTNHSYNFLYVILYTYIHTNHSDLCII
jgi:hypothetical protein